MDQRFLCLLVFFCAFCGSGFSPQLRESPRSSGSVAMTRSGEIVFVVNPESGVVSAIDTRLDRVVREVHVGSDPRCLALSSDEDFIFVTDQESSRVAVIDRRNLQVIRKIRVDAEPYGIVASPTRDRLYVASSAASVIDVLRFEPLPGGLEQPVTNRRDMIRPATSRLRDVAVALEARIPVSSKPKGLALSSDGQSLYVTHFLSGEISIIDTRGLRVTKVISTGLDSNMSQKIAIHPDEKRAYVPHLRSNISNRFLLFDTTIFPAVSAIDVLNNEHRPRERLDLSLGLTSVNLPFDVAFSADGRRLYSVNLGSEDVAVMDLATQQRIAVIDVGNGPRGIAVTPDGGKAYVVNTLSDDVSVIDLHALREITRISIRPSALTPEIRRGKIVFFSSQSADLSRDRWMSCASCHFEGEHDGRTWAFTAGPRNTTSLRGVSETLPLHWSADRDEIQDFEFTIRLLQAGSGLMNGFPHPELGNANAGLSADLDAMAAFVNTLRMKPNPAGARDVERGRAIFNSPQTGCSACHPAPLYTDSTMNASRFIVHDVGTSDHPDERMGAAFDTPSLRGIWDTAPYLHDGSAPTLRDVLITRNPTHRHGRTSHLSADEIQDLIAFLLSL